MEKVTLYQKNTTGKTKVWSIWVIENENGSGSKWVEHGQLGGKMQLVETVITDGKNAGKSNATTPYTQAIADAVSDVTSKKKKGYVESIENIQDASLLGSGRQKPMLAEIYDPKQKVLKSKNFEKLKIEKSEDVIVQDKLDGLRTWINVDVVDINNIKIQLTSRTGEHFYNFPHIVESVTKKIIELKYPVGSSLILDGELYCTDYPFEQISGLIRKEKRTPAHEEYGEKIKFWIYDMVLPYVYPERMERFSLFVDNVNIIPVKSIKCKAIPDEIDKYIQAAVDSGMEGLIIRRLNKPYEHKRTWQLMKYKFWMDEEFKIVGFNKSITGDTLGSIEFIDDRGEKFSATLNGTDVRQKEIWDNQADYLGLYGTVKYFELTTDRQVPRFGKCIKFRTAPSVD